MTAPVHIRPARAADGAALIAILHSTFQSTWRPAITPAAAEAYARENRPADYVARCALEFRVAGRAGEIIGLVHWRDAGRGYVEKGRYPDEEWNSGLTTLLLEKRLG